MHEGFYFISCKITGNAYSNAYFVNFSFYYSHLQETATFPEIILEQKRKYIHGIHFLLQIIDPRQKCLSAFLIWWHSTAPGAWWAQQLTGCTDALKKIIIQAVLNAEVVFHHLHQGATLCSFPLCKFWHWMKQDWFFFSTMVCVRNQENEV